MEIIKCDKCKTIKKTRQDKSLLESEWVSGNIRGGKPWEMVNFDLCEKCSKKLVQFIKNYLSK